jgi:hypothetical protein
MVLCRPVPGPGSQLPLHGALIRGGRWRRRRRQDDGRADAAPRVRAARGQHGHGRRAARPRRRRERGACDRGCRAADRAALVLDEL